jgi:hypothetical protein
MRKNNKMTGNVTPFPTMPTPPEVTTTYTVTHLDAVSDPITSIMTGLGAVVGSCFVIHDMQMNPIFMVPLERLVMLTADTVVEENLRS